METRIVENNGLRNARRWRSMCKSDASDALALSQHQRLKNRAFAGVTLNQRSVLGDCFAVFAQNRAVSASEIVRKFQLLLRRF